MSEVSAYKGFSVTGCVILVCCDFRCLLGGHSQVSLVELCSSYCSGRSLLIGSYGTSTEGKA